MKLLELFKADVPYQVVTDQPEKFRTEALINGRVIRFVAMISSSGMWNVEFVERKDGQMWASVGMTGSGAEFKVMSMVKSSLEEFIQRYHPRAFEFTADRDDSSRVRVYERMLKRLLPTGWSFERTEGDEAVCFLVRRAK